MSKKTPVKKSKRRLKKTARRSLAAILMISAIGVAAIPVPENLAAPEGGTSMYAARSADEHDMTGFGYQETGAGNPLTNKKDEENPDRKKIDLSSYSSYSTDELIKLLYSDTNKKGTIYPSYTIGEIDGTWDLSWQFMYYKATSPISGLERGVICKYNSEYPSNEVKLDLTPITQYYTVEESKYNDFYEGTAGDASRDGMVGMTIDPTKTYKFTYAQWLKGGGDITLSGLPAESQLFFDKYAKEEYTAACERYQKYRDQEDAYIADNTKPQPDTNLQADLEIIPNSTLSTVDKLSFYCDFDSKLSPYGSGYSLIRVSDNRLKSTTSSGGSGDSSFLYVAHGGTPITGSKNDDNGFLVMSVGIQMCAIGDRAFAGVGNVKELIVPTEIGYIGDEAFEKASLMEKITLTNVIHVGNRAFKGCDKLATVEIGAGTTTIGAECFAKSAVTTVVLPNTINTIGYGAFADCDKMTTLNLNGMTQGCRIKEYAFYNCSRLTDIQMADAKILSIGDGAFAVTTGSSAIGIVMPASIEEPDGIGNYMFAGRAGLQYVVMPYNYGRYKSTAATLPSEMFHGCTDLQYVEFPIRYQGTTERYAGGYVTYKDILFADVINPDFYVRGPELRDDRETAEPRKSTWDAHTLRNDFVPYVFENIDGVDCYEVTVGDYLYQANEKGELTYCQEKTLGTTDGKIVIPDKVGDYEITSIVSGCFDDENLRKGIKQIIIQDNSITKIDDGVFKDLPKLEKVVIGNAVSSIGNSAFAGCEKLEEVTFNSPLGGHAGFTIGTDAFKTGGHSLTFHGDIVEGYAPFDWALDKDNKIDENGIRVCYKSLAPTYLTVMYDDNTDKITLLDYPRYDDIDTILNEAHKDEYEAGAVASDPFKYKSYQDMREKQQYVSYANEAEYASFRSSFAQLWRDATTEDAKREAYASEFYGPWINPTFCNSVGNDGYAVFGTLYWKSYVGNGKNSGVQNSNSTVVTDPDAGGDTAKNTLDSLTDWLFEPLVVHAADDDPKPYYETYPYRVTENLEAGRGLNTEESRLVDATLNIVVPEAIESIDVYTYINGEEGQTVNNNTLNADKYLKNKIAGKIYDMYTRKYHSSEDDDEGMTKLVPGLFSGYYDDGLSSDSEAAKRGNDRIISVNLNNVTYLPDHAFDSCEGLQRVTIGGKCENIGALPFRGCTALTDVNISEENEKYLADNRIIYSRNGVTDNDIQLYKIEECLETRGVGTNSSSTIDSAVDVNIPYVNAIADAAFSSCNEVVEVYLRGASNLTTIPVDCFRDCSKLSGIYLSEKVNWISDFAFYNSNALLNLEVPGKEVHISTDAFKDADKYPTTVTTYEDSAARRYVEDYKTKYNLVWKKIDDMWEVKFFDMDGMQIGNTVFVEDGQKLEDEQIPEAPVHTGYTFASWVGTGGISENDRINQPTNFFAQYNSSGGMVDGKYKVEFRDGVNGRQLVGASANPLDGCYYIEAGTSFADNGITAEEIEGIRRDEDHETLYEPLGWSNNWTINTIIDGSTPTIIALYGAKSGGGTNTSGGTTNTSGGSTTNSSGSTTNTSNKTTTSSTLSTSTTSSSTSSSSTSTSSTTSGSGSTAANAARYAVFVENGSGSGYYSAGDTVIISANAPAAGMKFSNWTTSSNGVTLMSNSLTATTFTMPANNVTVTANYVADTTPTSTAGTTGGTTTPDEGSTRVDITKPGISNKDLATADVNGSTDNFIVKITETDEATQAVAAALTNKYNSLDNILYYAMDISLYDSTGTTKITDVTGLSIDITIPIPDALVAYGGNNMAGAVVNGNQLENLNERFTTVNGVPMVTFTATHFSPYTIYVDTGNLSAQGMLDVTPKTGDPIHPKWFLSIGLACLSIILFIKKDKTAKKMA